MFQHIHTPFLGPHTEYTYYSTLYEKNNLVPVRTKVSCAPLEATLHENRACSVKIEFIYMYITYIYLCYNKNIRDISFFVALDVMFY